MFCTKCGNQLPENAKFCVKCGAKIEKIDAPNVTVVPPVSIPTPANEQENKTVETIVDNDYDVKPKSEPTPVEPQEANGDNGGQAINSSNFANGFVPNGTLENQNSWVPPVVNPQLNTNAYNQPQQPIYSNHNVNNPSYIQPQEEKKDGKKKAEKPRQSVVVKVFSVLLSILLYCSLFSATLLTITRQTFTEENVSEWINEVKWSEISIADFSSKYDTLTDVVLDVCRTQDGGKDMTRKDAEKLIEKVFAKELLNDFIEDYRSYLFDGKYPEGISVDSVISYLKENEKEIVRAFSSVGYEGFYINYDKLEDLLEDKVGDKFSIPTLDNKYHSTLSLVRFFLSDTMNLILWIVTGLLAILLMLINLKYIQNVLTCYGVPAIVIGVAYLLMYLVLLLIFGVNTVSIIYAMLQLIIQKVLTWGIVLFVAGVLMVVAKVIIDAICYRYSKNKEAA